jgi:hypothetical protein
MTSSDEVRVGDGCVDIRGALASGRFFLDLKRRKTAAGPVFRLGHRTVTDFPDEVTLTLALASGFPCSKGEPPGPAVPSLEPLKSGHAEGVYIRELRTYPLGIDLISEGNNLPAGAPPELRERVWFYRFRLETKGVRLTDALLITLFSKEGKKVAELSWRQ